MSIITVQVGQCGNQVGHQLFSHLMCDSFSPKSKSLGKCKVENSYYFSDSVEKWFKLQKDGAPVARAVLVDTEQKVIHEVNKIQKRKCTQWKYDEKSQLVGNSGGAANNWAYGYKVKGPQLHDSILEAVRKEAEYCDVLAGTLSILSSSGGTGSGVGSYIVEHLRDEYPSKTHVNVAVLPYDSGDVITQNYNTVLTVAKLTSYCDMCIVFHNEHLHKMCSSLLKLSNVSFTNINSLIAMKIASVFQPVSTLGYESVSTIVSHLTPHRGFKLVDIRTAPHVNADVMKFETRYEWKILAQHLRKTVCTSFLEGHNICDWELRVPSSFRKIESGMTQYSPSLANLVITRGSPSADIRSAVSVLNSPALYANWIPENSRFCHLHQDKKFLGIERFITLATNNHSMYQNLDHIVDKAWKMFAYKAYVHQYQKFQVTENDFLSAFAKVEKVVKNYKDLNLK